MQVAIAVGTLLLGGWVLNSPPVDEDQSATTDQTNQTQSSAGAPSPQMGRSGMTNRGEQGMAPEGGDQQMRGRSRQGGMQGGQQRGMRRQRTLDEVVSPTEQLSPGAEGGLGQPTGPSGYIPGSGSPDLGGGNPGFGSRAPVPPTERPSSELGYRPRSRGMFGQERGTPSPNINPMMAVPAATTQPAATQPAATEKAFSDYRPPSGISPYMNLFRTGTSLGTVDNYTTLVQPQIEQRFMNQRFGRDIHGLQQDTRRQGTSLQQMNQQNQTLQGVGTPQFYMNYGNYYQGYGQ